MLLEQKPTDYSIDRQIWTGKIIIEVIYARWGIEIKDSRIYDILKEMRLSHQKADARPSGSPTRKAHQAAHRDYENSDPQVQKEFVATVKKNYKNWVLESG
jgi:transposase